MQFSIYWFRKRKKEIEIMSLFGKKKDEKEMLRNNQVVAVVEIAMKKALRQQRKLFHQEQM